MVELLMDCRRFSLRTWLPAMLWIVSGLVASGFAQGGGFEDLLGQKFAPANPGKAEFIASLIPATAKPGDEVTLNVTAKLPPNSYIYATTGDFEGRTQIQTKSVVGLEALDDEFQSDRVPETKMDTILKQKLSKFHGDVTWSKKFRVAQDAQIEKVAIDLAFSGQYCSEGVGGQCTYIKPPIDLHATIVEESASEKPVARFKYAERPKGNSKGGDTPVEFTLQLGPAKSSGGQTAKLTITATMDKDWHIFSTTHEGEGGSPTVITFENLNGLKPIGNFHPNRPPEIKREEGLSNPLEIYHEQVTWTQEFEILPGRPPLHYGIEGKIKYQTCKTTCLNRSMKFSIGLTSDDLEVPKSVDFVGDQTSSTPTVDASPVGRPRLQDKGLFVFILSAIGAALVSLLTPCVFPMVPITVSFFLKQNEARGGRTVTLALMFSASIIAAFVILGFGIAAIFGATKLNELANNSVLNLFLAGVFFTFALNMMGAFEIQIPGWLLNMTSSGEQTGGYVGVIFMALTFVLTSFSCTFPFVGSLLVAASQGEYYWPILGMLAFGSAFASPFFILALMPGMLKSLPKSGGWLNSVKVVMGFVELGVAVKYFSVVDQQLNPTPMIFDFTNVMTLWALLSICTGLYLLGQFRLHHDSPVQGLTPVRVLLSVAFLIFGGLFGIGVMEPTRDTWLLNQMIAFAPARVTQGEIHEIEFDRAVATATQQGKPLFLDFTGVNCVNCRLMEKRMSKPVIHKRLEKFVQAQLFCDLVPGIYDKKLADRILDRNITLQKEWFGDVTLPSYAIVTSDGKTILATFMGLAPTDADFLQFLDEGYSKWSPTK